VTHKGESSSAFPIFRKLIRTGATCGRRSIDCLGSAIAFRIAEKSDIPAPTRLKRGQRLVPVPLGIAGKLALYVTMIELGVNKSELARRLGVRETVIRRMLDPDHDTKSEKIQAALEALGKRIVVAIDDAA
jgi:antitoxin HicB